METTVNRSLEHSIKVANAEVERCTQALRTLIEEQGSAIRKARKFCGRRLKWEDRAAMAIESAKFGAANAYAAEINQAVENARTRLRIAEQRLEELKKE